MAQVPLLSGREVVRVFEGFGWQVGKSRDNAEVTSFSSKKCAPRTSALNQTSLSESSC
jgi:hypothetical protein